MTDLAGRSVNQPIQCQYDFTYEEFRRASRLSARFTAGARVMLVIMALAIMFVGAQLLVMNGGDILRGDMGSLMPAFIGITMVSFPLMRPLLLKRQFSRRPDRNTKVNWEISDPGFTIATPFSNYTTTWASVLRVTRVRDGFYIYPQTFLFYWLPLSAFTNGGDVERFAQLAQAKVPRYESRH